jgi:hypothetical protein
MMRLAVVLVACALVLFAPARTQAAVATGAATAAAEEKKDEPSGKKSPWLLMPTFSSDPKLGTSTGFMAFYMHYFDEKSQVSMFGMNGQYTSSEREQYRLP